MKVNYVSLSSDYLTLGQFLKEIGAIETGGMAKWFLSEHEVYVNGEQETRRGKKLYNGDEITSPSFGTYQIGSGS